MPRPLCELFRGTKSHGLVCAQFLCALNIYSGKGKQISKDGMTEFYHNLLMQALSKSNYEITLDFTGTSELVKKVNFSHQKMVYEHKKSIRK